MTPSIDGNTHYFAEHGLYDGLFLMKDRETGTFWDHLTGEAVYGALVGTTLEVSSLEQTTVEQLLDRNPDALVALSDRILYEEDDLKVDGLLARIRGGLNGFFEGTIDRHDTRRPKMDLGLGVWGAEEAVYYPYESISSGDRVVLDRYGDRGIVVYLDPTSRTLAAWYSEAEGYRWDGDVLRLNDGSYVEAGVLRDARGERIEGARPLQVFTRWYGFSLTFDGVEIRTGEG